MVCEKKCAERYQANYHVEKHSKKDKVPVSPADIFKHHAVAKPHNSQYYKADSITEKTCFGFMKRIKEIVPAISGYHRLHQFNNKNGHCHAENTISK
jgi:hypothetical protein